MLRLAYSPPSICTHRLKAQNELFLTPLLVRERFTSFLGLNRVDSVDVFFRNGIGGWEELSPHIET